MAKVIINPDSVAQSVAVGLPTADILRAKPKVVKVSRHPLHEPYEVSDEAAAALKAEKSVDKDGNEVPAVIDYVEPTPDAKAAPAGHGDMTASDLDKGGKKQQTATVK